MSAPSREHQKVAAALTALFWNFLRGKQCEVYPAPFDVRINYNLLDNTVIQPDLLIVCDLTKVANGKHCLGAPDMVIEILSESTRSMDKLRKFNIYLEHGVREYWIVHPSDRYVETYVLKDGEYVTKMYGDTQAVPVHVLEGCAIPLSEIFTPIPEEITTEEEQ